MWQPSPALGWTWREQGAHLGSTHTTIDDTEISTVPERG